MTEKLAIDSIEFIRRSLGAAGEGSAVAVESSKMALLPVSPRHGTAEGAGAFRPLKTAGLKLAFRPGPSMLMQV